MSRVKRDECVQKRLWVRAEKRYTTFMKKKKKSNQWQVNADAVVFVTAVLVCVIGALVVWVAYLVNSTLQVYPSPAPIKTVQCTMEAKLCPDGSVVGRTGPNCEFAPCIGKPEAVPPSINPEQLNLPIGYTLKRYTVAKVLETVCKKDDDCTTPSQYLMMSSCPYTSLCLNERCTVVCPGHESR